MPRYALYRLTKGELVRIVGGSFADYHKAFSMLLDIAQTQGYIIVGCHSDHIRGEAEVFCIVNGYPEEYAIREVEA